MECEIDHGNGFAGFLPGGIEPIETVHRFRRAIDGLSAGLIPRRIDEGKRREHAIAEEFQYLSAARPQCSGERLEDRIDQLDDDAPRYGVGDRREAADIGVPQHRTDRVDEPRSTAPA